jgi:transcriptional regulator with XRE-family HTH domain
VNNLVTMGREVVADGSLRRLRKRLGLNRSTMAELLQTSTITYTQWERKRGITLWPSTAARIGRFYGLAQRHYELLTEAGVALSDLVPIHHAATLLGCPQELIMKRYRAGVFDGEDLGILGLWLYREDLERIRKQL